MLKEKLMKKLDKKDKKLHPLEQKAKLGVIQSLSDQASDMMKGKVGGLKKVTVAADSSENLKKGLNKAEEIVEGAEEDLGEDLDHDQEAGESSEHQAKVEHDEECDTPEEVDAKIEELLALKKQMLEDKKSKY